MKIPSGKDGAIRIILKPILAPYSKIA
jgi:hypothetical protein